MLYFLNMLLIVTVFFTPCNGAQEPEVKRRKKKNSISSLQKLAVCSAVNMLESWTTQEFFKKSTGEIGNILSLYTNPKTERLIITKLLKKYTAAITSNCIRFKKEIKGVTDHTVAHVLQFNRQGDLLAYGGLCSSDNERYEFSGHVSVRNIETDQLLLSLRCRNEVTAVCFNATSDQLAIGHKGGAIGILSLEGKLMQQFTEHLDEVTALDYSPDGNYIASACQDGTVCIFNVRDAQCMCRLQHRDFFALPMPMSHVQWCNARTLFSSGDGWSYVWSIEGIEQQRFPSQSSSMVQNESRKYFMWKDKKLEVHGSDKELFASRLACYQIPAEACSKIFSLDGNLLAVGLSSGSVFLYGCPSYEQAVEPLTMVQALYVKYNLDQKAERKLWTGATPFAKYCSSQENEDYMSIAASLPDEFKKMVS